MKTLILAMMMVAGVTMNAQPNDAKKFDHKGPRTEHHEPFTPEQRAELRAKHLTLALDLTDKQQKELQKLYVNQQKEREQFMALHKTDREAGKKPTPDELFALQNKRLDAQIVMQRAIKKILTQEQYVKYEQIKERRQATMDPARKDFKRRHKSGPRK